MRLALVQSKIKFEDKKFNLDQGIEYICSAAQKGARLILFPEMSFTGFSMNTQLTGECRAETVSLMRAAALKYNISIGFGYVLLKDGKAENHYVITGSNGEILSDYIKIHSFAIGGEGSAFRSGSSLPVSVSICGHSVTPFICYDLRFPEIFRAVCDRSTIMIVAANWPAARSEHWTALLKARAIENQVYIIGINCTGKQDNIEYNGQSAVFKPDGTLAAYADDNEGMLICDIPDNTEEYRNNFPALKSRKTELYKKLFAAS